MKRLLILAALFITALSSLSAQEFRRRGFALGADRDTLLYIIASPFDNWYIITGGGIQTFMGNELISSARHNKLNFNGHVEIGKWVIPDLSVSLRLSAFNVDGQTKYGLQPFVDRLTDDTNANGYNPFHAHALALLGFVTLDWTNFAQGYEAGRRNQWHIFSPIGLGMSMLYGNQRNPRSGDHEIGDFRHNWELAFSLGIGAEYSFSKNFSINARVELFGSESTWDWSPYDNSYSIFDIIPTFNIGARFNLLSNVTKYNPYTRKSRREKVNHEFIAFGTRNTVSNLNGRIERLNSQIDSVENMSREKAAGDSTKLVAMNNELEDLQRQLDSARAAVGHVPSNVLEELIIANDVLNLPATIVYFQLDRYELDYNGRKRLQNFARDLNELEDTLEYYIIGAADSATGTIRHNQWLSERRCEAAYNMLVNHFGVSGNQLLVVPVGGITEYEPQENNRMAMVILRTRETEEIIDRWLKRK